MDDAGPTEPNARIDEREQVNGWRLHVLLQAGYPVILAERVAASDADLHQAVRLLQAGCPADVAAQILT